MKPPTINQVATWLPMKQDKLQVKVYKSYVFAFPDGKIGNATPEKPVYRYVKNFKRGSIKFSLCIISLESSKQKMQRFLNKVAKDIPYERKSGEAFVRTDVFYDA